MRKIVLLDDHFPTGEQTIQPVLLWGPGRNRHDLSHVTKTASEALEYIKHVTPEPGKTHMLVLALGSEEAYGPNRNGDGFPERPVAAKGKHASHGDRWWIEPGQELTKHYQTFETNPAHAFKHHVNKDPSKASGYVKKAFWNPKMHRVELLVVVDNEKDAEWVDRVNDGDFPAVSMGCRIKYDVCSICGNKAPTRAQYCDHVKFAMNQVNPDGTKNYVHNPSPNFFDISRVFRPADRTGYTLKKVAHVYELRSSAELGDVADDYDRKSAAIRKLSDIDKIVRGQPIASATNLAPHEQAVIRRFKDYVEPRLAAAPELPVEELLKHKHATVLSTVEALGMKLSASEFMDLTMSRLAQRPVKVASSLVDKVVEKQAAMFRLFADSPALLDSVFDTGMLDIDGAHVSPALAEKLSSYQLKRANTGEMLYRRLVPEGIGLRPDAAPTTDLLSYTDPSTGQTYHTTRGAAIDARDAQTNANWRRMLGGGALLYGGYKALSMLPGMQKWKLPLAVGAGVLGYHALRPKQGPQYMTDQGIPVPSMTEFTKGAAEDLAGTVVGLIEDYRRLREKRASYYDDSSLVQTLSKTANIDSVRGVEVDFEAAAEAVGLAIVQ